MPTLSLCLIITQFHRKKNKSSVKLDLVSPVYKVADREKLRCRIKKAREPTTLPARVKSLSRHKMPLYIKEKEPNLIIGLALGQHKSAI